jgi:hypothetical protein
MWKAIQKFALKVIETPYAALLLGFVVMILAEGLDEFSYGGVSYSNKEPYRSILFALGGATVIAGVVGLFRGQNRKPEVRLDAKTYGVALTYPAEGDPVPERDIVRGSIKKRLPDGYALCAARIFNDGWWADHEAIVDYETGKWHSDNTYIGDEQQRRIGVIIVGPVARALVRRLRPVNEKHSAALDHLKPGIDKRSFFLPPLPYTDDTTVAAQVRVVRIGSSR